MKKLILFSSVMAALASGSAMAETKSAEFHVSIKIKPACEFNLDNNGVADSEAMTGGLPTTLDWANFKRADINFGEHVSNGANSDNIDAESNGGSKNGIVISCTKGTAYKIGLSPATDNDNKGKGSMNGQAGVSGKIAYQLYQDSARGQVWGDQDSNMKSGTGLGFGTPETLPVYGRVLRADVRDMAAGRYSDKVTVKVEY